MRTKQGSVNQRTLIDNVSLYLSTLLGLGGVIAGVLIPGSVELVVALQAGAYFPALVADVLKKSIGRNNVSQIAIQIKKCSSDTKKQYLEELKKNNRILYTLFNSTWSKDINTNADFKIDSVKTEMVASLLREASREGCEVTHKDINDALNQYIQYFFINMSKYPELNQIVLYEQFQTIEDVIKDIKTIEKRLGYLENTLISELSPSNNSQLVIRENREKIIKALPNPIAEIDLFIPTIALIGAWRGDNSYDRQIIERISNLTYSQFEAKARSMLLEYEEYLQLENGSIWTVLHKEELLVQCKDKLFDDCLERLFEAANTVLNQINERVTSERPYLITPSGEYKNSKELRNSLVESICLIEKMRSTLSNCNTDRIYTNIAHLLRTLLEKANWVTWVSLKDCLQDLAELEPNIFLDCVENSIINNPNEILKLFPKTKNNLFGTSNNITELLWALETLAWSPDYLIPSIRTLGLLEALEYEKTNWANTPLNSIVSILLPGHPQTVASIDKRNNALKCLKNDNAAVFWKVLNNLLPNKILYTTENPRPKYLQLDIPEEISVTNADIYKCNSYLLNFAVEITREDQNKIIDLIDEIGQMDEPTLSAYLDNFENYSDSISGDYSFELWIKLRKRMAIIKPTEKTVIFKHVDRIQCLIKKLEPEDIRLKYREKYLGNRYPFETDKWELLENEKIAAVKEIFDQYGTEETEKFALAVDSLHDVAYRLGQSLMQDDVSEVINSYSAKTVSKAFVSSCIEGVIATNDTKRLINSSLKSIDKGMALELLTNATFSTQLLGVVNAVLPDDSSYWVKAQMPFVYKGDSEELKLIIEKLVSCRRYVTAVNIIGRSRVASEFEVAYICDLLKTTGTVESIGNETLDNYAVQNLIGWMQKQEGLSLELRSDIEFIYLPVLDADADVQPCSLYTRLSLSPDYFCSLIELFYKKRSADKQEIELDKGLTDRLFQILFQFKVTPGIREDGVFDEAIFKAWMEYVKEWSRENDRYEVTMQTVGSGLSYAPLDKDKTPPIPIVTELNKPENKELRRGFQTGIINQRGFCLIEPDGKPEKELAEENRRKAERAEEKGFSRYADVLKMIADDYDKILKLH